MKNILSAEYLNVVRSKETMCWRRVYRTKKKISNDYKKYYYRRWKKKWKGQLRRNNNNNNNNIAGIDIFLHRGYILLSKSLEKVFVVARVNFICEHATILCRTLYDTIDTYYIIIYKQREK